MGGVKDLWLDFINCVVLSWGEFGSDVMYGVNVVDAGIHVWEESSSDKDPSQLKGEESHFAYLVGCGIWNWVVSEKRMKLRKRGYRIGSSGQYRIKWLRWTRTVEPSCERSS